MLDLPGLLAGLVIMGGSTSGGNATAAAEFYIDADPEAAARVFDCGVPVAMFGLNVCRQLPIGQPQVDRLRAIGGARADLFAGYVDGYVAIGRRRARRAVAYDLVPVIWMARPAVRAAAGAGGHRADGRFTRGMTVC